MCGDWWDTYYNLLKVLDMCDVLDMCGICVVDTFGMDMCGICVMCWICVGYVWCEIRKQSSEEPCDETSFGKKCNFEFFSQKSSDLILAISGLQILCRLKEIT